MTTIFDRAFARGHQDPVPTDVPGVRLADGQEAARRVPKSLTEQLLAELLDELRLQRTTSTAQAAKLRGQVLNGVLESSVDAIDATGILTRTYNVAVGSLVVVNNTGANIIVHNGPAMASAPPKGRGVQIIPTAAFLTMPIGSRTWTIYGTAGQLVSFQAFTGLQPYGVHP